MTTKKDVRSAGRDDKIAKHHFKQKLHAANKQTKLNRKINQTANIKERKSSRIPNFGARRDRKNLRVKEGRGLKVGGRIADIVDNLGGGLVEGASATLQNPASIYALRGMPDVSSIF